MSWLFISLIFWLVFWIVVYLVARQLDTTDYTRKPMDIPTDESDDIYFRQEAYNRYTNDEYGNF